MPLLRATLASLAGDFAEAERLADEGLALGQRAQHHGVGVVFPTVIGMIRLGQGRVDDVAAVVAMLRETLERFPSLPGMRAGLAYALCEAGRQEEARLELERLPASDLAALPRDFTWLSTLAMLALACAGLDDRHRAAQVYALPLPFAPYAVRGTRIGVACYGAASHYLGLLAATLERWDDAARHFEAALEMDARLGAPAYLANSRYQYARVLRRRGRPGDLARAAEHLHLAYATAATLGIRLQLQDLDDRACCGLEAGREGLGQKTANGEAYRERVLEAAAPAIAEGLTAREVEILRLVAAGQSNKEIAATLALSIRTVERHITNLYTKIDARGRADATAYALRHGLA